MEKCLRCEVQEKDSGRLLELFLKKELGLTAKEISRAKFRERGICVNGKRCKVNTRIFQGDLVEVLLETENETSRQLVGAEGSLQVLYEDGDVLVVYKPAGMVTHPTGFYYGDTLANRLASYLRNRGEDSVIRILGRLDKETSGIILVAKNRAAALRLERQREEGRLKKTYLAVTDGIPPEKQGSIEAPIGMDPERKGRMLVCPEGKEAFTCYEVLETRENQALVQLELLTGRTHQIRVHMASIGCPLWGDPLYNPAGKRDRMYLQAISLRFFQPFEEREIFVEMPPDFAL